MRTKKIGKNLYRTEFSFSKAEAAGDSHVLNIGAAGFNYKPALALNQSDLKTFRDTLALDYGFIDPNLNSSDIVPKPEDFMPFEFRLLSATVVAPYTWRATEFPEAVLKASTKKLENKPVFTSHYTSVDNVIGQVKNPVWSKKSTEQGKTIPAGIDGVLMIDTKIAPRVARNLLTGNLFSNSVTVVFDWKPSHSFESDYEFRESIGTLHKDGEMVRRIATVVHGYRESSVVFLGADPYAKLRSKDNGTLVQIDHEDTYNVSFSKEATEVQNDYEKGKNYFISCGFSNDVLSLAQSHDFNPFKKGKNKPKMNESVYKALLNLMGLPANTAPDTLTEANLSNLTKLTEGQSVVKLTGSGDVFVKDGEGVFTALSSEKLTKEVVKDFDNSFVAKSELSAKETEIETLKKDKETLETKVTTLEPLAAAGEIYHKAKKEQVVSLYKAANMGKTDTAVLGLFEKATPTELDGLLKQYVTDAAELTFKGKCGACGSADFTFQHSLANDPTPGGKKEDAESAGGMVVPSLDELREMYNKPQF